MRHLLFDDLLPKHLPGLTIQTKQQELLRVLVRMIEQHLQTSRNPQEVRDDAHRPR